MGLLKFFAYRHPILNFFVQDPDDPIKGWLRRTVIVSSLTLTFSLTVLNDLVFYPGDNTESDLTTLRNDRRVTPHLGLTLFFAALVAVIEWWNEFMFGMTQWKIMQYPCCLPFKYALYYEAFWLLLLNVLLYIFLLRNHNTVFIGIYFSLQKVCLCRPHVRKIR